jgi:hypothetical protein
MAILLCDQSRRCHWKICPRAWARLLTTTFVLPESKRSMVRSGSSVVFENTDHDAVVGQVGADALAGGASL